MIFRSKVPRSIEQEAPFLDIFPQKALRYKKKLFIFAPANEKGAIAQLVEQRTENPCVPGSIPGGTTFLKGHRNVAQLVAHYVRDVGVGRSSRLIPTEGDKRAKSVVAFSFSPSQTAVNLRKILKTSFSFSVR